MLSPSLFTYVLNDQPIFCVDQHPYLGVTLTSNMSFSPHIQKITAKATRVLNFIKRNLYNCSKEIKSKAYLTLVRPILEYASSVWDPHLIKDSDQIEKVQRAAARWVTLDYSWSSSVTVMLNNLNWPTLSLRRKISKLQIFYKAIHNLTALGHLLLILCFRSPACIACFTAYFHHYYIILTIIAYFNKNCSINAKILNKISLFIVMNNE